MEFLKTKRIIVVKKTPNKVFAILSLALFIALTLLLFACEPSNNLSKKVSVEKISIEEKFYSQVYHIGNKWFVSWDSINSNFILEIAENINPIWNKCDGCNNIFDLQNQPKFGDSLILDMYTSNLDLSKRNDSLFASFDVDCAVNMFNCKKKEFLEIARSTGYETIEDCFFLGRDSLIILGYEGYSIDNEGIIPFIKLIDLRYKQSKKYMFSTPFQKNRNKYFFNKFKNIHPFVD